jgi:hypothetical protein
VRDAPPVRRRLATLFVDIAGSTSLLVHHPPEVVLGVVQGFMTLVTEVASAHAGTVKDFEGRPRRPEPAASPSICLIDGGGRVHQPHIPVGLMRQPYPKCGIVATAPC